MIKETTGLITLTPENIPVELAERPQWVCWRLEERDGKMTKMPYTPEPGMRASTTDLMTWRMISEVLSALREGGYDGIGFVFSSADPYVGIDIDDCRDPELGRVAGWAREIIDRVPGGYTEVSPSGTGIHIIVRGKVRGGGMRKGPIEMYSRGRFFTITGRML
jgi:putative DNA primase/helicase